MTGQNTVVRDDPEIQRLMATSNRLLFSEDHLPSDHVSMRHPFKDVGSANTMVQPAAEFWIEDVVMPHVDGEPLDSDTAVGERGIHSPTCRLVPIPPAAIMGDHPSREQNVRLGLNTAARTWNDP